MLKMNIYRKFVISGVSALMLVTSAVSAQAKSAPNNSPVANSVTISADTIRATENGKGSWFQGNVKLKSPQISISAAKVLVQTEQGEAKEYIIFGKGVAKKDNATLMFKDALYLPAQNELIAAEIKKVE